MQLGHNRAREGIEGRLFCSLQLQLQLRLQQPYWHAAVAIVMVVPDTRSMAALLLNLCSSPSKTWASPRLPELEMATTNVFCTPTH